MNNAFFFFFFFFEWFLFLGLQTWHSRSSVCSHFNFTSNIIDGADGIIVVMGHSHYGPVFMVHMVVIMVHLGKLLWSTWLSRYGPPKKLLWSTIRNIRNNVEMGSKL